METRTKPVPHYWSPHTHSLTHTHTRHVATPAHVRPVSQRNSSNQPSSTLRRSSLTLTPRYMYSVHPLHTLTYKTVHVSVVHVYTSPPPHKLPLHLPSHTPLSLHTLSYLLTHSPPTPPTRSHLSAHTCPLPPPS